MKKILLNDGMEIIIVQRIEDFEKGFIEYLLKNSIQIGQLVTEEQKNLVGTYQLSIQEEKTHPVMQATMGISMDGFILLIQTELGKDPENRYDGAGWTKLFNYLEGNIDSIVDIT